MFGSIFVCLTLLVSTTFAQNGQQQNLTPTQGSADQLPQGMAFPNTQPFAGQGANAFAPQPGTAFNGVQANPQNMNTGQSSVATGFQFPGVMPNTAQMGPTQTGSQETVGTGVPQQGIITSQGQTFVSGGQTGISGNQFGPQFPQTGAQVPVNAQANGQVPGQPPLTPGQIPFGPVPPQGTFFPQNGQNAIGTSFLTQTGVQNPANPTAGNQLIGQNPFGVNAGNQIGGPNPFAPNAGNQLGGPNPFAPNAGNQLGGPNPFAPNAGNQLGGPNPFAPNDGNQIAVPNPFGGNQIGGPTPFAPNAGNQNVGQPSFVSTGGAQTGVPSTGNEISGPNALVPNAGNQIVVPNPFAQNAVGGPIPFNPQTAVQPQPNGAMNVGNQIGGQIGPQVGGFNPNIPPPGLACHTRGCPSGSQCVFAGPGDHMCPTWIPILPCQCRRGCRSQNQFIPFGTSRQNDVCGNRCTCNSADGQAACTRMACPQQGKK